MALDSIKRTPDAAGDDIGVVTVDGKKVQATANLDRFGANDVASPSMTVTYVGKTDPGGTWLVMKIDTTSGTVIRYATAMNNATVTDYATAWAARATTLVYGTYDEAF